MERTSSNSDRGVHRIKDKKQNIFLQLAGNATRQSAQRVGDPTVLRTRHIPNKVVKQQLVQPA